MVADPQARFLVVDDEPELRELLQDMLEDAGFAVVSAANGADALTTAEGDPSVVAIITDISMPKMSGLQLLERLRTAGCELPISILTAHADRTNALRALRAGAFEFIEKPWDARALTETVKKAFQIGKEVRDLLKSSGPTPTDPIAAAWLEIKKCRARNRHLISGYPAPTGTSDSAPAPVAREEMKKVASLVGPSLSDLAQASTRTSALHRLYRLGDTFSALGPLANENEMADWGRFIKNAHALLKAGRPGDWARVAAQLQGATQAALSHLENVSDPSGAPFKAETWAMAIQPHLPTEN